MGCGPLGTLFWRSAVPGATVKIGILNMYEAGRLLTVYGMFSWIATCRKSTLGSAMIGFVQRDDLGPSRYDTGYFNSILDGFCTAQSKESLVHAIR